jgi:VWFA-related protein
MRRVLPVIVALWLAALPLDAQEQTTFRAGTDAVRVDVSVRDGARVVTGLAARDFIITDNGVAQDVADVSYGKLPIDVTIALDVSFSVTGPLLDNLRRAILQLLRDLGPDDRLKLTTFNMRITRVLDFSTDATAVEQAILAVKAGGGTSVWDAVAVSLVSPASPDRRQLVVLFSDALDTTSALRPSALADIAQRTNTTLTAVVPTALSQAGGRGDARARLNLLQTLGKETGGSVIPVGADLTATFRKALDDFRSSYVLHFIPHGVERTGFHELEVKVNGHDKAAVRARRGYIGG